MEALVEAEDKAAKEHASREKHEARVGEVQQQLQGDSLERDFKAQGTGRFQRRQLIVADEW